MKRKKKIYKMTEEELRVLSLEKGKNGCATEEALKAQRELYNRSRYAYDPYYDHEEEYNRVFGPGHFHLKKDFF